MNIYGETTEHSLVTGGTIDGDLEINGDGHITGDLLVDGTITASEIVVVDEIKVSDAIILMGHNNPADTVNLGILEEFVSSGVKHSGLMRSAVTKKQYLIENVSPIPTISTDLTLLNRGNLVVNGLESTTTTTDTVNFNQSDTGTVDWNVETDGNFLVFTPSSDNGQLRMGAFGFTHGYRASDTLGGYGMVINRSRGTITTPTAVGTGDFLNEDYVEGHDGTGYGTGSLIKTIAAENFTPTNRGSKVTFDVTDIGTTTPTEKLRLDSSGVTISNAYTLPDDAGTSGDVLVSDGLGDTSWEANEVPNPITQSTGVFTGGVITIGANPTLFDISAGTGQVANPNTGALTPVSWGDLDGNNGVYTELQTYILIDINGVVVKTDIKPSNSDLRDNMLLGVLISTDTVNILAVASEQMFLGNTLNQISDLAAALGSINTSGNVMGPSTLLTVAKTTGTMYAFGSNTWNDKKNPSNITTTALDTNVADTFQYFYQDGSFSGLITDVIPNEYDDGNGQASPGSVSNNNWQTQRVYLFPEGNIVILPSQFTYANLADAKAAINSEQFITLDSVSANGLLISYIFMRGAGSDLNTSPGDAEFLQASRISGASGATAGGDVNGPVTSTINGLCKFSTTDGKTIKDNSGAILTDTGDLSLTGSFDLGDYSILDDSGVLSITQNGDKRMTITNQNLHRWYFKNGFGPVDTTHYGRGTESSPSAVASGDFLNTYAARGYWDNTQDTIVSQVRTRATQNFSLNNYGVEMFWDTTNNGGGSARTQKLKLSTAGVTLNDAYTMPLVDGTANQTMKTDGAGQLSFSTPSYANIGIINSFAVTAVALDDWTSINGTVTAGLMNDFTNVGGILTYNGTSTKTFEINISISWQLDADAFDICAVSIHKNGSPVALSEMQTRIGETNKYPTSISTETILSCVQNDTLEVKIKNKTTTSSIEVNYMNLVVTEI